jgi:hypothetical protein
MSYREKVQKKLQDSERAEERASLWEEICTVYEEGGIDQVESRIIEKADVFKSSFDEVIQKLQEML